MEKNQIIKFSIYFTILFILALALFYQINPFDPSRIDSDNDGVMDDKDIFPNDRFESTDSDKDGCGDNSDKFPNDPAACEDSDDDGYPDEWNEGKTQQDSTSNPPLSLDAFPYDPNEHIDTDGDGVGDNSDVFPNDSSESRDDDNDGVGNNKDKNPEVNLGFTLTLEKFKITKNVDLLPRAQIYIKVFVNGEEITTLNNNGSYWKVWLQNEETIGFTYAYDIPDDTDDDTTHIEIIMYDRDFLFGDDIVDINSDNLDTNLNIIINHQDNSVNKNEQSVGQSATLWFNTILPESVDPTTIYTTKDYAWSFQNELYELSLEIPTHKYYYLTQKDVNRSPQHLGTHMMTIFVTEHDTDIKNLAQKLLNLAEEQNFNDSETVNFILSFVQQNIDYKEDMDSRGVEEYWKYPLETLYEKNGDCEDSSTLFQSIMKNTPYDVVMLFYIIDDSSGHLSSGVHIDEELAGHSITHKGKEYYYCETTSSGFVVGEKPSEIPDKPEKVIVIP